jgi:hypothetical protein
VDNSDGSFLIFRATKVVTAETKCRDFDTCFAEISKRDAHVTPSQFLGPVTDSPSAFAMPKRPNANILGYG